MSRYLTGNDDRYKPKENIPAASAFAQVVLPHVGGSCVYIEPSKGQKESSKKQKFVETEKIQ